MKPVRVVQGETRQDYTSLWLDFDAVRAVDLRVLPQAFSVRALFHPEEVADDIKKGLIAGEAKLRAAGAFGMALAVARLGRAPDTQSLQNAANLIIDARPDSEALKEGILAVQSAIAHLKDTRQVKRVAYTAAQKLAEAEAERCRALGEAGQGLVKKKPRVCLLGHWGWLTELDWGTAPAPAFCAHRAGVAVEAWVCETRPSFAGARLAAWELKNEGIPTRIVPDLVAGEAFREGGVDAVWLGARALYTGAGLATDAGAFALAASARACGLPVYAAAPLSAWRASPPPKPAPWNAFQEALFYEKLDEEGRLHPRRVLARHQRLHAPGAGFVPLSLLDSVVHERGVARAGRRVLARVLKDGKKKR